MLNLLIKETSPRDIEIQLQTISELFLPSTPALINSREFPWEARQNIKNPKLSAFNS